MQLNFGELKKKVISDKYKIYIHLKYQHLHLVFKILLNLLWLKHFKNIH